ncbi:hypothetical protein JD969_08970 [Planctomycetota bacterium]|nr:hypothetical protein JD969_08970 [Planctomycetota bacterium]
MNSKLLMLSILCAFAFSLTTLTHANTYHATFSVVDPYDDDPADGFDHNLFTTGEMLITVPASITLDSHTTPIYGTKSEYSGITIHSLSLPHPDENISFLNNPASMELTDVNYSATDPRNKNKIEFLHNLSGSEYFSLLFETHNTHPNYNNIFDVSTPNPHTLTNNKLSTFVNITGRDTLYTATEFFIFGDGTSFYNGYTYFEVTSLTLIPEPASLLLLSLSSLILLKR